MASQELDQEFLLRLAKLKNNETNRNRREMILAGSRRTMAAMFNPHGNKEALS